MSQFKRENTLSHRKSLHEKIQKAYPLHCPIIVESRSSKDPQIQRKKFLISSGASMGKVFYEFHKHMPTVASTQAIIFFTENLLIPVSDIVDDVYFKYHDEDGFLYITYTTESTFG